MDKKLHHHIRKIKKRELFSHLYKNSDRIIEERIYNFQLFVFDVFEYITTLHVENPTLSLELKSVERVFKEQFSKSCRGLSSKEVKFYSRLFEKYLAEEFKNIFTGLAGEIKKQVKIREIEVRKAKERSLKYVKPVVASSGANMPNQLILNDLNQTSEVMVIPKMKQVKQLKQVEAQITIPRPTTSDYSKCVGKYVVKNCLWLAIIGFLFYLLVYNIWVQGYTNLYRMDLMLPLDWELPNEYVYGKFPEMYFMSHIAGVCFSLAPVIVGVMRKTMLFKKAF